jgi:ATP-binding cassette, subfamily B (MDR/TAP), member 1
MNVQNFSSLLTGIIIAMVWSWQLSLVAIGLMPLMIIAGVIQMKFIAGFSDDMSKAYKDSSAMIMEVVSGIRTVKSFAQEDRIKELYEEKMRDPYEVVVRKGNVTGVLFGFSQMVMFLVFGIIFYIGALFIGKNIIQNTVDQQGKVTEAAVEKMFVALFAIMFAAMGTGNNAQFMPDVAEGNLSASRIF